MTLTKAGRLTGSFGFVIVIWWATSGTIFVEDIVPDPVDVANQFLGMTESNEIWAHLGASFRRIGLGVLMGATRTGREALAPWLEFFRNIPPVALVPLVIAIFGIGETGKYFIIAYATAIVMIINTGAGVAATPRIRIRAAECLGASRPDIFLFVVMPSAWPYILTGLRIALGYAFTGIVAAEMLAAQEGIGFLIMQSTNILEPRDMWIGFFLLGGFGMLTDQALRAVVNRLARRHMIAMGR